jgi:hypothetical protein
MGKGGDVKAFSHLLQVQESKLRVQENKLRI